MLSTTVTPSTSIITDVDIADGILHGFDVEGQLIVSMRYMPRYERLMGTEGDEKLVTTWHVSPDGARRIASIAAWRSMAPEYPTAGSA